jgi:hypothetical protein
VERRSGGRPLQFLLVEQFTSFIEGALRHCRSAPSALGA